MRQRQIISFIAIAASLTACSEAEPDPGEENSEISEITVLIPHITTLQPAIEQAATDFGMKTGIKVNVVGVEFDDVYPELEGKSKAGSDDYDVYLASSGWVADFVNLGYAEPLDSYLKKDADSEELALDDIPDGVRTKNSFGGKTYSMLVDNDNQFLFYRKDVLGDPAWQEAFKADPSNPTHEDLPNPPRTLSELLTVAKFFADKDWSPDVTGEVGFVTASDGYGSSQYYVQSWVAPYAVMPPDVAPSTGLLFFKPDMTPLVNLPGFVRGVSEWKEMVDCCTDAFNPDEGVKGQVGGDAPLQQFIRGQALMVINWGDNGPGAFRPESIVQGKVGFAMAPGASEYYDWQTEEWVTPSEPNFAPVHQFNGWALYMASTSTKKDAAWQFMRYFTSPQVSLEAVVDPAGGGGYQPWRTSHSTQLEPWAAQSWQKNDAQQYVQTILDNVNHPNRVLDIRIPGASSYQEALEAGVRKVIEGKDPQAAMDDTAARFMEITKDLGLEPQIAAYRAHLE